MADPPLLSHPARRHAVGRRRRGIQETDLLDRGCAPLTAAEETCSSLTPSEQKRHAAVDQTVTVIRRRSSRAELLLTLLALRSDPAAKVIVYAGGVSSPYSPHSAAGWGSAAPRRSSCMRGCLTRSARRRTAFPRGGRGGESSVSSHRGVRVSRWTPPSARARAGGSS